MPGPPIYTDDSILFNVNNLNGYYRNCALSGSLRPAPGATVVFFDCFSAVPGTQSPVLNLSGSAGASVSFRSYSGGIRFISCSDAAFTSTVEFVAGRFNIDSSCTQGFVSVRGVAALNNTGATMTIETGSLINAASFNNINVTAVPDANLNSKVDEIWKIHGLDSGSALLVTTSSRVAGDVTQSISHTPGSNETIVTRI